MQTDFPSACRWNSESLARVQAGVINLEDQVRAQLVGICRALPHPLIGVHMGLGLVLLQEPLRFQPRALAVCLEESPEKPQLHLFDCWVPGWTLIKGNLVTMQKRQLNMVEVSNCAQYWPIKNSLAFCVEAKKVMGQSSCKGDLGSPLMCRPKLHLEETPWVQMGILTAFNEDCVRPYVFSRIGPFSLWLKASTRPQHPPWARPVHRPTLSSLPKPEALVNRISLRFAMPWQALIVTCDRTMCSSSILSPSWVLTSAHCVRDVRSENMAVLLGLPQPGGNMTAARVSSVVLHEQYQVVNGVPWNDLALILLQKPLGPTQPLAPVGHVEDMHKAECWLMGARELREGERDQYPQVLQVQVKDALSCAHLFPGIKSSVL
ncbi:polyserase-2-like, partial [Vombatus ursinus]|uniref:polyserase-2-like n=1 Tax=Vombatus ursinus TaxID=29139 RepID=UPI000FFD9EF1